MGTRPITSTTRTTGSFNADLTDIEAVDLPGLVRKDLAVARGVLQLGADPALHLRAVPVIPGVGALSVPATLLVFHFATQVDRLQFSDFRVELGFLAHGDLHL